MTPEDPVRRVVLGILPDLTSRVRASTDGSVVLAGDPKSTYFWRLTEGAEPQRSSGRLGDLITNLERTREWITVTSMRGDIGIVSTYDLLDARRGRQIRKLHAIVNVLARDPQQGHLALGGDRKRIEVFDGENGSVLHTLRGHTAAVTALGAKYLARKDSKILGCIGSRGFHSVQRPTAKIRRQRRLALGV